ncbi:MAG: hypothetical protein CL488_02035 [Acidobacteria bacterium]|nr:hypothetical protein [Acidobacteriota bacterium]
MVKADELAALVAHEVGDEAVKVGTPKLAVAGVTPLVVVCPEDAVGVSKTLRLARDRRLAVVPTGAGTKLEWGASPPRIDLLLSLCRLDAVVAHRHGDLTATVQAGASLKSVNSLLRRQTQWLPLDTAHPDLATIGGIVATNDSGPRRHRYGAPRDLILGVTFARADGEVASAGGIVVKNVAGYDLSKLLTGSFGSLGVILEATFKLAPLPLVSRTVVAKDVDPVTVGKAVSAVTASQLVPSALEVQGPPFSLLARFEGSQRASERQVVEVVNLWQRCGVKSSILSGSAEIECWRYHHDIVWGRVGDVCRIGLLPTDMPDILEKLGILLRRHGSGGWVAGLAGIGVIHARLGTDAGVSKLIVEELRSMLASSAGYVVLLRGSPELRANIDAWGPLGDAKRVMGAVKRQFDPNGILSPGQWPIEVT